MTDDPIQAGGVLLIDDERAGTAWRIGPKLALTAAHCLRKDGTYREKCEIQFEDDPVAVPAQRIDHEPPTGDETDLDVAILALDRPGSQWLELATLPWPEVKQHTWSWSSWGYPDVNPVGMELTGRVLATGERSKQGIQLQCDQGSSKPEGLVRSSGAPIVVDGKAVALIHWAPGTNHEIIYAKPMDRIARRFQLTAPLHGHHRTGTMTVPRRHLRCDRKTQWGEFTERITASPSVDVLFVRGTRDEKVDKFIARMEDESVRSPTFSFVRVRWDEDAPRNCAADYLADLARSVFDEKEVSPSHLAERLLGRASTKRLVIAHPEVDLSTELDRARLAAFHEYYFKALPRCFAERPIERGTSQGVLFVQPIQWQSPRGLARFFGSRDPWHDETKAYDVSPLIRAPSSVLQRITHDDVVEFLHVINYKSDKRERLLRDIKRSRTTSDIFFHLERIDR